MKIQTKITVTYVVLAVLHCCESRNIHKSLDGIVLQGSIGKRTEPSGRFSSLHFAERFNAIVFTSG